MTKEDHENKKEWTTVRIPEGLLNEVEEYLKSKDAERRGFTSLAGFVEHCVRKQLGLD